MGSWRRQRSNGSAAGAASVVAASAGGLLVVAGGVVVAEGAAFSGALTLEQAMTDPTAIAAQARFAPTPDFIPAF